MIAFFKIEANCIIDLRFMILVLYSCKIETNQGLIKPMNAWNSIAVEWIEILPEYDGKENVKAGTSWCGILNISE